MDSIADRTGVAIRAYDKRIAELEAEIEKLRLDAHTQEAFYSDRIQEIEAENKLLTDCLHKISYLTSSLSDIDASLIEHWTNEALEATKK